MPLNAGDPAATSGLARDIDDVLDAQGFAAVFRTWAAGPGTVTELRNGLNAFFNANPTPTQLKGVLQ